MSFLSILLSFFFVFLQFSFLPAESVMGLMGGNDDIIKKTCTERFICGTLGFCNFFC